MLKLIVTKFLDAFSFEKKPRNSTERQLEEQSGKHIVQKEISFNLHNQRVDDVAIPKADIVAAPDKITLSELTKIFVNWLISKSTKKIINNFKVNNKQLFFSTLIK